MAGDDSKDRRILGLEGRVPKSRQDQKPREEGRSPTAVDVQKWVEAASITAMRNTYEALAAENVKLFAQMEEIAVKRVLAEIEQRSIRPNPRIMGMGPGSPESACPRAG